MDVYLKNEMKLTPLVYRWPAWSHLIAPATHALHLAYRNLIKLRSFVTNPQFHVKALRDPTMMGSQFISLSGAEVGAAREYIQDLEARCAHHIEFAMNIRELGEKLIAAKGFSLDQFSRSLPTALRGRLELVYDLANQPRIKLFEELLYGSELDTRAGQAVSLELAHDHERPFFMGAPMLDKPARVVLPVGYDNPCLDRLASMRTHPGSLAEVRSALGVSAHDSATFETFFTDRPPTRKAPSYDGDGVRIRYFGHACVLVQAGHKSILIDPVTGWERDDDHATLTFDDLPDVIDYVVLTHAHQDHLVPEMLLQLRHRIGTILVPCNDRGNLADPSMKLLLRAMGYHNVVSVEPFDRMNIGDGEILSLPFVGEHGDLDINSKQCIAIRARERTLVFLVDSNAVEYELYAAVARRIGKVDALFLGMECRGAPVSWLYGPLLTHPLPKRDDESRRLSGSNCDDAWRVVKSFECSSVFVYAMGQERWVSNLMGLAYTPESIQIVESDRLVEKCRSAGLTAERLFGCKEWVL